MKESYSSFSLKHDRSFPIASIECGDLVVRPGWIREVATATPRGSLVNAVTNDERRFIGILSNIDGESLELTHCICREVVPDADGGKQCQSSYLSSQSIQFSALQHLNDITHTISSPSELRRNAIQQHDRNPVVDSIVLKNGRRMHIPDRTSLEHETRTKPEIDEDLAQVPLGSEICIIDESDRCMNAVVLSSEAEHIGLMNIITQDVVPDLRGQPQTRTSHMPFERLDVRAIRSFRIVATLPSIAELIEDEFDCYNCKACTLESFDARNGNRYGWGKPYSLND